MGPLSPVPAGPVAPRRQPRSLPPILQALTIEFTVSGKKEVLTLEIQQHLGGGVARAAGTRTTRWAAIASSYALPLWQHSSVA